MDKLAQNTGVKDRRAFVGERNRKNELMLPPDRRRARGIPQARQLRYRGFTLENSCALRQPAEYDMVVQREPAFSEVPGGAADAQRTTPDGSKPGVVFVRLLTPGGYLKTEIPDLMCHEGVPGHLLQGDIMYGKRAPRNSARRTTAPSRLGLDSETLCKEMGVYKDAYEDYARLEWELWRAVRLVVDTGLHAKSWSEDEGVNTRGEHRAGRRVHPSGSAALPAQPRSSLQLQSRSADDLAAPRRGRKGTGSGFDVRGFHDMVVGSGSLPLSVLETRVQTWIAARKGPVKS